MISVTGKGKEVGIMSTFHTKETEEAKPSPNWPSSHLGRDPPARQSRPSALHLPEHVTWPPPASRESVPSPQSQAKAGLFVIGNGKVDTGQAPQALRARNTGRTWKQEPLPGVYLG